MTFRSCSWTRPSARAAVREVTGGAVLDDAARIRDLDGRETLAAYEEAVQRGCRVVAVSAGGELAARSSAEGVPHVAIPGDVPVPRAALGDLAGAPVGILEAAELIPSATSSVISAARLLDA